MDPLILSITAVVLGVMALVGLPAVRKEQVRRDALIEEAKRRAAERAAERKLNERYEYHGIEAAEYTDEHPHLRL